MCTSHSGLVSSVKQLIFVKSLVSEYSSLLVHDLVSDY